MMGPPRRLIVRLSALLLLALLALATLPARAAEPQREGLLTLQRLDARVQTVGWRLVRSNARFCRSTMPSIGLQLHDVYNYPDPPAVRRALQLGSDIAVQAVAAGSPADRAGLAANQALSEAAGTPVAMMPAVQAGNYARLVGLHERIAAELTATGSVTFEVLRPTGPARMTVAGEEVCTATFEMITDGNGAAADGERVVVSRKLVESFPDDDQLAALLAHELAHNVLSHRARLDTAGRSRSNVLATEREADRLSVWLLANAGYDPAAALRFMARWGPPHDHGILSKSDHDRWKARYKRIDRELSRLAAARAADPAGAADWPRAFAPDEPK